MAENDPQIIAWKHNSLPVSWGLAFRDILCLKRNPLQCFELNIMKQSFLLLLFCFLCPTPAKFAPRLTRNCVLSQSDSLFCCPCYLTTRVCVAFRVSHCHGFSGRFVVDPIRTGVIVSSNSRIQREQKKPSGLLCSICCARHSITKEVFLGGFFAHLYGPFGKLNELEYWITQGKSGKKKTIMVKWMEDWLLYFATQSLLFAFAFHCLLYSLGSWAQCERFSAWRRKKKKKRWAYHIIAKG